HPSSAHLDPPPFPTRRSSDLPAFRNHADGELGHLSDFFFKRHALEQGFDLLRVITLWPSDANGVLKKQIAVVNVYFHWSSFVCLDRKSTRLNSSHVSISYAVF